MHNLQKPIVGTLVQGWTNNPCLTAGLDEVRSIYTVQHEFAKRCIRFNMAKTVNNTPTNINDKVTTHSLIGCTHCI